MGETSFGSIHGGVGGLGADREMGGWYRPFNSNLQDKGNSFIDFRVGVSVLRGEQPLHLAILQTCQKGCNLESRSYCPTLSWGCCCTLGI